MFLTGHTGFKGSWMALWLKALGAEVTAFALPPDDIRGNHFNQTELGLDVVSILGDARDFGAVQAALEESRAEIVFHLAAQPLVRQSYDDPIGTYASNVMGTVHVLDAVRQNQGQSVKAIVNITTDKCYENKEWHWAYRENDALGGYDPYSSSKACAELVSSAYRQSFFEKSGVNLATARAGNVIGGGDFATDRIIPDIVEAIGDGKAVLLRNPKAIRPWQHVLDALFGYLILGMKLSGEDGVDYAQAYNFSPSSIDTFDVETITQSFIEKIGQGSYKVDRAGANVHEAKLLRLDPSLAQQDLGWTPMLDVDNTMDFTVDWYQNYLSNTATIKDFTLEQLNQYMKKIEVYYD